MMFQTVDSGYVYEVYTIVKYETLTEKKKIVMASKY